MSRQSITGLALPLQVSNVGLDGVTVPDALSIKQGTLKLSSSNPTAPTSSLQALSSGVLVINPSADSTVPSQTTAIGLGIGYSMDGGNGTESDFVNYCNSADGDHAGFTFWQARTNSPAVPIMYLSNQGYGGLTLQPYVGQLTVESSDLSVNCQISGNTNQMIFTAVPEPAGHATAFAWACTNGGGAQSYPMTLSTSILTLGAGVGFICPGYISSTKFVTTGPYANDGAAAAGGVPIGGLYRVAGGTGQVIQARIA